MTDNARVSYQLATAGEAEQIRALFRDTGCPCFCQYYLFQGSKNDWLDRCANAREENEASLSRELEAGFQGGSLGIVALTGAQAVGWMRLGPAETFAKTYDSRLYRRLPCFEGDRSAVWTIGCFLVREEYHGRGVSAGLIEHGVKLAAERGARAVEAFPRRAELLRPEEKWTGSLSALSRQGFVVVHDFAPYPVLRRELSSEPGAV